MCEPVTILAVTGLALSALGTGMSVYGQVQSGKAQNSAAKFNAQLAEMEAKDVERRGVSEQANHARKVSALKASQRAEMAGGGIDLTSDSAMEIFAQTAEWGERDMQTIQDNTNKEAWGLRTQSSLFRSSGKNAKTAGYVGGGSTLLNGVGNTLFAGASSGMFGGGSGVSESSGGFSSSTSGGRTTNQYW